MCRLRVTLQDLVNGLSGEGAAGLPSEGHKLSILLRAPVLGAGREHYQYAF